MASSFQRAIQRDRERSLKFEGCIKKKFRWGLKVYGDNDVEIGEERLCKVSARPNLVIEETEINFLSTKSWIPGKGTWESITAQALAGTHEEINELEAKLPYIRKVELRLYDGCGYVIETWVLTEVKAGTSTKVLYRDSDEADLEMELRYTNCEYKPGDKYNASY